MYNLFYMFGVGVLLINTFLLFNHKQIFNATEWIMTYKKLLGKDPAITEVRKRIDFKMLSIWSLNVILTLLWTLCGLLTDEWIVFLSLLVFNVICNRICLNIKYSEIKRKLLFTKSTIAILVIGFLITKYLLSIIPS